MGEFRFGECDDQRLPSLCRYRIGPFEVESALIEHPAVVESAVVSSPDPIRGEVGWMSGLKQQFHFHVLFMCLWQRPTQGNLFNSQRYLYARYSTLQMSSTPKEVWDYLGGLGQKLSLIQGFKLQPSIPVMLSRLCLPCLPEILSSSSSYHIAISSRHK